jgi:hypothetical protein
MKAETFHKIWAEKLRIAQDYRLGKRPVECGELAIATALCLREEGRPWKIVCLHHGDYRKGLQPKLYPDLVWDGHVVCISEGLIFDPILPEPCPREEYGPAVFP